MKTIRQRALPHPLLSPFSTDVQPPVFFFDCADGDITCDRGAWRITGRIRHESAALDAYVASGAAILGVHVECSRTFFRQWFPTGPEVRIDLPADSVRGKVEMLAVCVAAAPINGYALDGQHQDYGNATFDIAAGDLLAAAPHVEFDAYLDLDPIQKISSILDIKKSADRATGPAHIDFAGDRIEVELAQSDYANYIGLRADPSLHGMIASNVVMPAVLQAVNHLGRMSPDDLQDAKDGQRWCRCLMARLDYHKVPPTAEPSDVFVVVQTILRDPVRRGLDDMINQLKGDES